MAAQKEELRVFKEKEKMWAEEKDALTADLKEWHARTEARDAGDSSTLQDRQSPTPTREDRRFVSGEGHGVRGGWRDRSTSPRGTRGRSTTPRDDRHHPSNPSSHHYKSRQFGRGVDAHDSHRNDDVSSKGNSQRVPLQRSETPRRDSRTFQRGTGEHSRDDADTYKSREQKSNAAQGPVKTAVRFPIQGRSDRSPEPYGRPDAVRESFSSRTSLGLREASFRSNPLDRMGGQSKSDEITEEDEARRKKRKVSAGPDGMSHRFTGLDMRVTVSGREPQNDARSRLMALNRSHKKRPINISDSDSAESSDPPIRERGRDPGQVNVESMTRRQLEVNCQRLRDQVRESPRGPLPDPVRDLHRGATVSGPIYGQLHSMPEWIANADLEDSTKHSASKVAKATSARLEYENSEAQRGFHLTAAAHRHVTLKCVERVSARTYQVMVGPGGPEALTRFIENLPAMYFRSGPSRHEALIIARSLDLMIDQLGPRIVLTQLEGAETLFRRLSYIIASSQYDEEVTQHLLEIPHGNSRVYVDPSLMQSAQTKAALYAKLKSKPKTVTTPTVTVKPPAKPKWP